MTNEINSLDQNNSKKEKTISTIKNTLITINSGTLKKSLFFFTSLEINNVSSVIIIKIDKYKNEQTIELDNRKISIEELYWSGGTHKTSHRKLNTEKINSFKIRIYCMNNNRCYTSDEVKIQKNNFI